MERPENSHKLYFIYAPLRPSLFNPSVLTQFWRKKNIIVEQGSAFNKTSLSVCCAVILLHHTLLLLHGLHLEEIQKCRNTEIQKYRNTKCSPGIARRSTSASRPSSRLGLAMLPPTRTRRSFTPSSWCSLAVSGKPIHHLSSCFGWPPELKIRVKLFGVHPWCGQSTHPPTNQPQFGFHCRYSSLLPSTQLNISFETSVETPMTDVVTFDILQNL